MLGGLGGFFKLSIQEKKLKVKYRLLACVGSLARREATFRIFSFLVSTKLSKERFLGSMATTRQEEYGTSYCSLRMNQRGHA